MVVWFEDVATNLSVYTTDERINKALAALDQIKHYAECSPYSDTLEQLHLREPILATVDCLQRLIDEQKFYTASIVAHYFAEFLLYVLSNRLE